MASGIVAEDVGTPTPGPWIVDEQGFVYAQNFIEIAMLKRDDGTEEPYKRGLIALPYGCGPLTAKFGSTRSNARLIAAAPDLLDALRAFCGDYEATPTTGDTSLKAAYLHALTVIARAEGREP